MAQGRAVFADASPLIGLAAAGAFDLLRQLFGEVCITDAVRDEIVVGADLPGAAELVAAINAGWVRVVNAAYEPDAHPTLGPGEASTLAAALAHTGDVLLILDDKLGRAEARRLGLCVTGALGILLAAKRRGLIPAVRGCLDRLEAAGYHLGSELTQTLLEAAEENSRTSP